MATIEIDGKTYQAQSGQMLIDVADANGIDIPRFCYHKKLSVAANCRMCLVEVEKAPKPLPACATPVMDGMKVFTRSVTARTAQKAVMEFLLINHPLDCPICDQGGECELQDLALGYGDDHSRLTENKRAVVDKELGPLIATEMTRCIHCTRCVRFTQEIAGIQELGGVGRGEHTEIGTYVERNIVSELSANITDLCPVGALTLKPSRFSARPWELQQYPTVAPHDSVGSNLYIHVLRQHIKRVVPKEAESINEVWLADRDRFSYEGLLTSDRLTTPMIKQDGHWQAVNWEVALNYAAEGLKQVIKTHQSQSIGALASPTATLEELYLLQKLMRGLGSQNIDHRLRQVDFSDQDQAPLYPYLGQSIAELEQCDVTLVIGSHLRKEQPLLNHRLRKATLGGGQVMMVNPLDYEFNFPIAAQIVAAPHELVTNLAGIAKALLANATTLIPARVAHVLADINVTEAQQAIAQRLRSGNKRTILLGQLATAHPQFALLRSLAAIIAKLSHAVLGYVGEAGNTAGAWLAGVLPHRGVGGRALASTGLSASAMLTEGLKGYILLGLEPELDSCQGALAVNALEQADWVISLTAYRTPVIERYAQVMLPIGLFAEIAGTYVNIEHRWQTVNAVVAPPGEARPAWKILRVLGNVLDVADFDYVSLEALQTELQQQLATLETINNNVAWQIPTSLASTPSPKGLQRITEMSIYAVDAIVRRSSALQRTVDTAMTFGLHLNHQLAQQYQVQAGDELQVTQGEASITLPVFIDNRVPEACVLIYGGEFANIELGVWHGEIKLSAAP